MDDRETKIAELMKDEDAETLMKLAFVMCGYEEEKKALEEQCSKGE